MHGYLKPCDLLIDPSTCDVKISGFGLNAVSDEFRCVNGDFDNARRPYSGLELLLETEELIVNKSSGRNQYVYICVVG